MKEIRTEILINAPVERVWEILINFEEYPEWNPFIISIIGQPSLNSKLKVSIQPPDSKPMIFKPSVTILKKNETFGWLGNMILPILFSGHHIFEIKPNRDNSCLFIHREEFRGILVPLLWKSLDTKTKRGFESMNEKLKLKAEIVVNPVH